MTIYFYTYFFLSIISILPFNKSKLLSYFFTLFLFIFLLVFIGLRDEIGGDWYPYLEYYHRFKQLSLLEAVLINDIGYDLINWIVSQYDGSIYLVNYICALLFLIPLFIFCNNRKYFLISILISFPYLITVVSMGYVRQAVALGLFILGLSVLESKKINFKFVIFTSLIIIAFTFHKSAIILFTFIFFYKFSNLLKIISLVILLVSLILLINFNFFENIYTNYVVSPMSSRGTFLRISLNSIPAVGLIFFYRYFKNDPLSGIFLCISLITIISIFFINYASTLIDRISLYFMLLQVYFWPKFISLNQKQMRIFFYIFVLTLYFIYLLIWFNYSDHTEFWTPYKSILVNENHNSIEQLVERY